MQFIQNAPFYKLVRITGPQHNLLVLKLSSTPTDNEVVVERLDADRGCPNPIPDDAVREQVVRAMNDYRAEKGAGKFVECIQYLEGDSRPIENYYLMAWEIFKRVEGIPEV
jgi:hypothetical protein